MINNVVLVGRLTKDADLRYTSNGTAVASFTVAVNRSFKKDNEEQKADFINCVAWRKTAEALANFTHKGSLIGLEGQIQTRSYENKEGQRVYVTEVNAREVKFLESKKTGVQDDLGSSQTKILKVLIQIKTTQGIKARTQVKILLSLKDSRLISRMMICHSDI